MDLSWPHLQNPDLNGTVPISVNSSVNKKDFPVSMVGLLDILRLIDNTWGPVFCAKLDWEDAYKHVHVHPDDLNLQDGS